MMPLRDGSWPARQLSRACPPCPALSNAVLLSGAAGTIGALTNIAVLP
jgi:hypothetical protein